MQMSPHACSSLAQVRRFAFSGAYPASPLATTLQTPGARASNSVTVIAWEENMLYVLEAMG